jgi:dTDP-4-amino-4,6-dideoxygalactose transaminase
MMQVPAARITFPEEDKDWILQKMREVLDSGWLTLGKFNKQLEEEFAKRHRVKHAVAVNSGTSAIEIILRILNVEGKEVIVPTNTFFATAAAVVHAGARPRFADISPQTFTLSLETIKRALTRKTVGVIIVHIGGLISPEILEIKAFCDNKGLFLIEDAAHAHGSSFNGQMAGTFGIASSFSFYPTKVMTSGEGGMIVTNEDKIKEEALIYRDQGKAGFYGNFHVRMGYNWRMSELHAIVGLAQLRRLDEFIAVRRRIARLYDEGLKEIEGVQPVLLPPGVESCYYKYMALLERGIDRSLLKKVLKEQYGVTLSGEVYEIPLHRQPVFERYSSRQFPIAEDICARHICLPIYSDMTEDEAQYVINSLAKAIRELKGGA